MKCVVPPADACLQEMSQLDLGLNGSSRHVMMMFASKS